MVSAFLGIVLTRPKAFLPETFAGIPSSIFGPNKTRECSTGKLTTMGGDGKLKAVKWRLQFLVSGCCFSFPRTCLLSTRTFFTPLSSKITFFGNFLSSFATFHDLIGRKNAKESSLFKATAAFQRITVQLNWVRFQRKLKRTIKELDILPSETTGSADKELASGIASLQLRIYFSWGGTAALNDVGRPLGIQRPTVLREVREEHSLQEKFAKNLTKRQVVGEKASTVVATEAKDLNLSRGPLKPSPG